MAINPSSRWREIAVSELQNQDKTTCLDFEKPEHGSQDGQLRQRRQPVFGLPSFVPWHGCKGGKKNASDHIKIGSSRQEHGNAPWMASVARIPDTAIMAQRPFVSSASEYHLKFAPAKTV